MSKTLILTVFNILTDVLLSEIILKILGQVRSVISSSSDLAFNEIFESKPGLRFWLNIIEAVNDSHSVERIAEELLRQLATQKLNEVEGYWILWMLFGRIYRRNPSIRYIKWCQLTIWFSLESSNQLATTFYTFHVLYFAISNR